MNLEYVWLGTTKVEQSETVQALPLAQLAHRAWCRNCQMPFNARRPKGCCMGADGVVEAGGKVCKWLAPSVRRVSGHRL